MPKSSIVRLFLRVSPEIFETILFFDNQASLIAYIESAGAGEGNRQLGPCGLAREVGDYVFGEGRALDFRCDRGGAQVNGFFLACVGNTRYFHFEGGHFGGEAGFVHQDSHLAFAVGNQFEESFPVGERGARGDRRDGRGAEEKHVGRDGSVVDRGVFRGIRIPVGEFRGRIGIAGAAIRATAQSSRGEQGEGEEKREEFFHSMEFYRVMLNETPKVRGRPRCRNELPIDMK